MAWLGAVLIVLWVLGWLAFKVASGLIHLVLIVGVALIIWSLVKRGARAVQRP